MKNIDTDTDLGDKKLDLYLASQTMSAIDVVTTDGGVYYSENSNIKYLDLGESQSVILCNDLNCTHDNATCKAFIENSIMTFFVNKEKDKIFYTYYKNPDVYGNTLGFMDLNGENRMDVFTLNDWQKSQETYVLGTNMLYFVIQEFDSDKDIYKLLEIDLSTGQENVVLESGEEIKIIGAYDNFIVYEEINGQVDLNEYHLYHNINKIDVVTKNVEFVAQYESENDQEKFYFVKENILYHIFDISNGTAKFEKLDMVTNENNIPDTRIPFYGIVNHNNVRGFFGEFMIIDLFDGEIFTKSYKKHTYLVNLTTFEAMEITMRQTSIIGLTPGTDLSEFEMDIELDIINVLGTIDSQFVIHIGNQLSEAKYYDENGVENSMQVSIGTLALLDENSFLSNEENYKIFR